MLIRGLEACFLNSLKKKNKKERDRRRRKNPIPETCQHQKTPYSFPVSATMKRI